MRAVESSTLRLEEAASAAGHSGIIMQKSELRSLARALGVPVRTRPFLLVDEAPPSTRRHVAEARVMVDDENGDGPLTVRF